MRLCGPLSRLGTDHRFQEQQLDAPYLCHHFRLCLSHAVALACIEIRERRLERCWAKRSDTALLSVTL